MACYEHKWVMQRLSGKWNTGKIDAFTLMQQVTAKYIFRGKYHATLTEQLPLC